nr:dihydrofolate reductase family protein [uncultured Solibaculum sp.]
MTEKRPYIICHMVQSIDGKVTGDFLSSNQCEAATESYYQINRDFHADAFACGRVTMEGSFTGGWYPDLVEFEGQTITREDYVANPQAGYFAVAFDRHGRLGWKTDKIIDDDPGYGNAHIIEVLCEDVPDAYLFYLKRIGISYIFAGRKEMDLSMALHKLKVLFSIDTLLLEGGSILNGSFQREHFIDELSLVLAPIAAAPEDKPLFMDGPMTGYALTDAKPLGYSAVWLRYKKESMPQSGI